MMAMISRPTREMATTSVRRITGGYSLLLSGTGVPSCPLGSCRSPGKGFVGGDLEAKGLAVEGLAVAGLSIEGLADTGLVGMTLTMVSPARGGDHRQTRPRDPDWHHNVAQTREFQFRWCELCRA